MASFADRMVRCSPYALLGLSISYVSVRAWGPLSDPDSWWHLRLGEDFLHRGSLAPPGSWSTFATSSWVPTQPLPEMAAGLINTWFGLPGLVWLYVATVVALIVLVFLFDRQYGAPLPAAVATILFLACGEGAMTPRPQLLSYGFLVVVLAASLRAEGDLRPRWWLIPVTWLWSLCHGFWFVGVGYEGLCVVAVLLSRRASLGQISRLVVVPLASAAVVLLNPVGWRVFAAPFVVSQRGAYITEWQRSNLTSGPPLTALVMVVATVAIWAWKREHVSWLRVLLALTAVFWAWYAVRTVILAGIVMSPLLAEGLQSLILSPEATARGASRRERLSIAGTAAALLTLVAFVVPHTAQKPGGVPLALNAKLDLLPPGTTVLNDYTLGGWLSWRHPDLNRWIDGLADAYPVSHLEDTATLVSVSPGWHRVLVESGADAALLRNGSALANTMEVRGWSVEGTDGGWVLLTHG